MKRVVNPSWFEMDRLRAIRSIIEHYYENDSAGLEEATIKAIWYVLASQPERLNELVASELALYVELSEN